MKKISIALISVTLLVLLQSTVLGQSTTSTMQLTADSLTTGNAKDVFKSFLQLAFDRFTSDNKELKFSSNPFAIMAKMDTTLLVDNNYVKYRHLRNLNLSFSGKLDSSYHFNGFSSGITYALVNQRDETVSKSFVQSVLLKDDFSKVNLYLTAFITGLPVKDSTKQMAFLDQANKWMENDLTYDKLDPELQKVIKDSATTNNNAYFLSLLNKDSTLNFRAAAFHVYDSLRSLFQKRWLVTVGVSDTSYKDHFMFSNVVLTAEILKGISNPNHVVGMELDVKGAYRFLDDTLKAKRDLQRKILDVEGGVNVVFNTRKTHYPWAEFKLSGEYHRIFQGAYAGEKRDSLTINGVLRFRVAKDIWVPLEIKYDPGSGNVFGFLSVRFNFKGAADKPKK